MIIIGGIPQNEELINNPVFTGEQQNIVMEMLRTNELFTYTSFQQFLFEINVRSSTISASRALLESGVRFSTFANSKGNPQFWDVTPKGAIVIKPGIKPSDALSDIFRNGSFYSFECATAMIVVFFRAVLENIDVDQFDRLFDGMILYDWQYDEDLGVTTTRSNEFVPGDCVYFINPDVAPETSYFRGENAIYLGSNLYYGHGIGIMDAQSMIDKLNTFRIPGSLQSAYLMSQVTRLGYKYLFQFSSTGRGIPIFLLENKTVIHVGSYYSAS